MTRCLAPLLEAAVGGGAAGGVERFRLRAELDEVCRMLASPARKTREGSAGSPGKEREDPLQAGNPREGEDGVRTVR